MCFFHLNFLNAGGSLAQKIYNVHAIFHQFSDIKNDPSDDPNNQPSSVIWLLVNHNALELTVQKKANLIIRPHK